MLDPLFWELELKYCFHLYHIFRVCQIKSQRIVSRVLFSLRSDNHLSKRSYPLLKRGSTTPRSLLELASILWCYRLLSVSQSTALMPGLSSPDPLGSAAIAHPLRQWYYTALAWDVNSILRNCGNFLLIRLLT